MQSYCAVRHSKFLYFCNTPYCFLRAKCLTSLNYYNPQTSPMR